MEPSQSALIVPIPEAEPAVGRFRASLDRAASWGVPAHVTVLYPFLPPERIDEAVLAMVRDIVAAVPRFDVSLAHVDWFGDTVVWLAPQPDHLFRDLTAAVWRRFPEAPPYAGAYSEVVPHLTIGDDAARPVLENAAEAVSAHLPIRAAVDVVRLITGTPDRVPWCTVCDFPLGTSSGTPSSR
ncbi:2'-5' RNA ligase family protein [Micromonospora globbae]|uniref:2'-5' RNA ligase family protein n=1 Tax=Micromonospora globbae TaxID=1894969 RepID=UPI00342EA531